MLLSFLFGKKGECRRLNKDAASIVEATRFGQHSEKQCAAALLTRRSLAAIHEATDADPGRYAPALERMRVHHREARRGARDAELTAFTLCIIYLRSEQLGEEALPARESIDDFLSDWAHVEDDFVSA